MEELFLKIRHRLPCRRPHVAEGPCRLIADDIGWHLVGVGEFTSQLFHEGRQGGHGPGTIVTQGNDGELEQPCIGALQGFDEDRDHLVPNSGLYPRLQSEESPDGPLPKALVSVFHRLEEGRNSLR
jgi:hypothetical protein